jgi:hypothetical protein
MKKLLFMFATAALVLSACSSEDDIVQGGGSLPQLGASDAVGFDVYTQQATNVTKAGLEGTMTTNRMQRSEANGGGFGVYAYLTEDDVPAAGDGVNATAYAGGAPNFMVNEKILWNSTSLGWYYSPLKYWPNETDNDSQTTPAYMENSSSPKHLDRLTFFAYAPYVAADDGSGTGITYITDNAGKLNSVAVGDPTIAWVASTTPTTDFDPNKGVDLLWGVAPSGGLSYTAVNGWTVTRNEGTPLLNMIKPNVNTSMKFLFQHALARFGVTVVAAIDQVAPGGKLDPNTKITVNSFKITGPFGTGGELNLNNGVNANIANWTKMTGGAADETINGTTDDLTSDKVITVSSQIADNLKYAGVHTFGSYSPQSVVGVTTAKQDLLDPSTKWFNKLAAAPAYNPGKKYVNENGTEVHATYEFTGTSKFYTLETDHYVQKVSGTETAPDFPAIATTNTYYMLEQTGDFTADPGSGTFYSKSGDVYTYVASPTWNGTNHYYTVKATKAIASDIPFAYTGDIYEAERNYLYVVPTNNVAKNAAAAANEEALRTITVQIEYYITTEDSKVNGGRTQTKNVVTKTVVLPSLANGKSYNLNLVLGLTSVKIEAEVDDWKVANSQVDLPQNAGE